MLSPRGDVVEGEIGGNYAMIGAMYERADANRCARVHHALGGPDGVYPGSCGWLARGVPIEGVSRDFWMAIAEEVSEVPHVVLPLVQAHGEVIVVRSLALRIGVVYDTRGRVEVSGDDYLPPVGYVDPGFPHKPVPQDVHLVVLCALGRVHADE